MLYKLCIITRLKIFKVSWATNIELIKFPIQTEILGVINVDPLL